MYLSADISKISGLSIGVSQTKIVQRRDFGKRGVRKIIEPTEHGSVPSRHIFLIRKIAVRVFFLS